MIVVKRDMYCRWQIILVGIAVAIMLPVSVWATHIIGGDISMKAIGTKPGFFRLQLNQYWDETQIGLGNRDPDVKLLVFRKNNPTLIDTINVDLQESSPLTFGNAACAKLRNLNVTEARYYRDYQFDTRKYTDPGGYYIVWERCCRNNALTNAVSIGGAGVGMVFYLEFPAMIRNGAAFANSAPDFGIPNGDYICINKLFTYDISATDSDGDQLRYSLVTPLNGYTNTTTPLGDQAPKNSYPLITWSPGISLQNVIPGDPPLSINQTTGQLSVKATQEGLFLFTVQCEEFRNGVRIGVVRRDFQLPVVDCSKNTPPPAIISVSNAPASSTLVWCASQPLVLSVEKNPIYAYQWQRDGTNLRGSVSDTIQVRESGVYTVVRSQARVCANDTISKSTEVTFVTPPPVKLTVASPKPYCAGDTINLQAQGQPDYVYQWRLNGKDLAGEQKSTLKAYQSGQYVVRGRPAAAVCNGEDSTRITINARPIARIGASLTAVCPNDSALLIADPGSGYRYRWLRNTTRLTDTTGRIYARQTGTYQVTVTNPAGCTAVSNQVPFTVYPRLSVQLDSIPPVCGSTGTTVTLKGQPAGGIYSGPGVTDNLFDPVSVGKGVYKVTYTITSAEGCPANQSRSIVVAPGPILSGETKYQVNKGSSVQLLIQSSEQISRYRWDPPTTLSRSDIANPMASPLETTPYSLTAVGISGCPGSVTVLVEVTEAMYIPSAFSPNSDGLNDVWVIPNASSFPKCEVSIFNRWGELVFFSLGYTQPWDGTYRQERVSAGVYSYQIRTGEGVFSTTYRGQLTVLH